MFNTFNIKKYMSFLGERFEAGWVKQDVVAIEQAIKDAHNG
jgi:hypothetical protein